MYNTVLTMDQVDILSFLHDLSQTTMAVAQPFSLIHVRWRVVVLEADGQEVMVMNQSVQVGLESWLGNGWHNARSVIRLAVGERRLDTTSGRCKVGLRRVSQWAERLGLGDCMALREVHWRSPSPSFEGFLERFLFFPQITIRTRSNSNPGGSEQVIRVHNHKQNIQLGFLS